MSRNVAKLMARLNPKSMPLEFTGARGTGTPELTAVDIAGALGAASAGDHRHRLAVDVLCLRWWPARVEGPTMVVGYKDVKRRAGKRRGEDQKFYIERMPIERTSETAAFLAIANLIERRLAHRVDRSSLDAKLQERILTTDFLKRWSRAVLDEYRNPHHCQTCKAFGRPGEVPAPVEEGGKVARYQWITCPACDGAGLVAWGVYRRAKAVRMREGTFRGELNSYHDGALALLRELEHRGAVRLVERLGR